MKDIDKVIEEACCPPVADSGREMPDIDKIIEEAKSSLLPFESWERLPGESGALLIAAQAASMRRFARTGISGLNGVSARR
jgi:hypothetical protein